MTRRIICLDTDPQWHEERHKRITGSDVAILFRKAKYPSNLSEYEKIQDLHRRKKTLTAEEEQAEFTTSRILTYGQVYEYVEMMMFQTLAHCKVRECKVFLENPLYPGLGVTLDGLVSFDPVPVWPRDIPHSLVDTPSSLQERLKRLTWGDLASQSTEALQELVEPLKGVGIYEQKTAGEWPFRGSKKEPGWKTEVPMYYWLQVQAQLAVTGFPWAIISCSGDRDRVAYVIEPCKKTHAKLKHLVEDFWQKDPDDVW